MQTQVGSSYKLAIHQVRLQNLIPYSSYCPETILSIFSNGDLDPRGSKYNTNQSLHKSLLNTKLDYKISFLTPLLSAIHCSIFKGELDLYPRGSKNNTNRSFHIRLLYTKSDYNTSFQTLDIVGNHDVDRRTDKLTPIYIHLNFVCGGTINFQGECKNIIILYVSSIILL
jgi:hypothetical protein